MVVQGPDSKRDGRALSALLRDPPEVSRYLRSDSVVTADDGERRARRRGRLRCAAQSQREAKRFRSTGLRRRPEDLSQRAVAPLATWAHNPAPCDRGHARQPGQAAILGRVHVLHREGHDRSCASRRGWPGVVGGLGLDGPPAARWAIGQAYARIGPRVRRRSGVRVPPSAPSSAAVPILGPASCMPRTAAKYSNATATAVHERASGRRLDSDHVTCRSPQRSALTSLNGEGRNGSGHVGSSPG